MTAGSPRPSFGIHISRGADGGFRYPVEQARTAKAAGFDSVWVADHLNGFPVTAPAFEPFTLMGFLAREVPGLRIGCAATDPYRRHPALLAKGMATIAAMTGQRPVLAIGSGEGQNMVPYGWRVDRPLARTRETVEVVRRLLRSSVEAPVTVSTERFSLQNAFLQRDPEAPVPAIHLAANGPKMRRMVGEIADGWTPMMLRPELLAEDLAEIRSSAEAAGRDPAEIEVVYHTSLALGASREEGLRKMLPGSRRILLAYPPMAARLGTEVTDAYAYRDLVVGADNEKEVNAAAAQVPAHVIERTGVYGTPEDCVAMLEEYVAAGVDHFVFRCTDPIGEVGEFFSTTVLPRFRRSAVSSGRA